MAREYKHTLSLSEEQRRQVGVLLRTPRYSIHEDAKDAYDLLLQLGHKRVLCTATFSRADEVEWWEWLYDEETKRYINRIDGSAHEPKNLLALVYLKQAEGWELCRAVV